MNSNETDPFVLLNPALPEGRASQQASAETAHVGIPFTNSHTISYGCHPAGHRALGDLLAAKEGEGEGEGEGD